MKEIDCFNKIRKVATYQSATMWFCGGEMDAQIVDCCGNTTTTRSISKMLPSTLCDIAGREMMTQRQSSLTTQQREGVGRFPITFTFKLYRILNIYTVMYLYWFYYAVLFCPRKGHLCIVFSLGCLLLYDSLIDQKGVQTQQIKGQTCGVVGLARLG